MMNTFRVGCDPEFAAIDGRGHIVNVSTTFGHFGPIGWDHSGNIIEIRPEPAMGTFALTRRLQKLVGDASLQKFDKLRAGAYFEDGLTRYTFGGHVHIGMAPEMTAGGAVSIKLRQRVDACDAATVLLEHLDILPEKECQLRRGTPYGKLSNIRIKGLPTDNNYHWEYRVMPSWLHDPKVAYLCMTAVKLAAADPERALEMLKGATSFKGLQAWIESCMKEDPNAVRASRLLDKGHKPLVVDPTGDFRERWGRLGL